MTTNEISPSSRRGKLTQEVKESIVDMLSKTGNLSASASGCGVTARACYYAMQTDEAFKEAIQDARQKACLAIELEIRRRAIEGVDKNVYFGGEIVGVEKHYSDKLLLALAKANIPEKYSEHKTISINQEVTINHTKDRLADMLGIAKDDDVLELPADNYQRLIDYSDE